ncbi:CotH kinase family protein [bacterium AH-315-C07]|nr:CotH kinase family protein [bacterium AH-315-C07]
MKYIILSICLLNGFFSYSQDLYDINNITEFEITFTDPDWDQIMDDNIATENDARLLANVVINGISFENVGVKYKGNSSYDAGNDKNPLNIKLDYIDNSQDYNGYSVLKLSNIFKDPSCIREVLGYEISRKYTTASLANFANVYINGDLIGLYTSVESVNDNFTNKHYYSEDLPLFKGENIRGATGCAPGRPKVWPYDGNDTTCYYRYYEIESDYGWQEIMEFSDTYNNNVNNIEQVLYVDRHLWSLAFDLMTVNLDAPINIGHNYYLYQDNTKRFNHIIWDLNMCFGSFTNINKGGGPPGPGNGATIQELQELDIFFNESNNDYPIIGKVLSEARYKKMYLAHLITIMEENFSNGWYETRALELQSLIDLEVQADNNKFYTYTDFTNNIDNSASDVIGITELMEARLFYMQGLAELQYIQPAISKINTPAEVLSNSEITITANVSDANYVYLGYRDSKTAVFEKVEMFDDGLHDDGNANDDIYAISISTGTSEIQYYIYSENDDIGAFSPERAEYEFHTLSVSGDVVINEIMASNNSIQDDQDGEFNDWIELYNNTSSPISLAGYYLSDDVTQLNKWALPDTTIDGNGYIIIWADKDSTQSGLHANFKISASGEAVFLSYATSIRSEVMFSTQTADISYGRYPNGTGSFTEMPATFNAENSLYASGLATIELKANTIEVYPNPTRDIFRVNLDEPAQLSVYDLTGRMMESHLIVNNKTIDASYWENGVYLLRTGNTTKKLVKY